MTLENKIIIYGVDWCGDCWRTRTFLQLRKVSFEFINIDKDKSAEEFVLNHNHGYRSVPTIVFPDGSILVEPSNQNLAKKLDDPE